MVSALTVLFAFAFEDAATGEWTHHVGFVCVLHLGFVLGSAGLGRG